MVIAVPFEYPDSPGAAVMPDSGFVSFFQPPSGSFCGFQEKARRDHEECRKPGGM